MPSVSCLILHANPAGQSTRRSLPCGRCVRAPERERRVNSFAASGQGVREFVAAAADSDVNDAPDSQSGESPVGRGMSENPGKQVQK